MSADIKNKIIYDIDNSFDINKDNIYIITYTLEPFKQLFLRDIIGDKLIFTELSKKSMKFIRINIVKHLCEEIQKKFNLSLSIKRVDSLFLSDL